jgi:hypothetical protein
VGNVIRLTPPYDLAKANAERDSLMDLLGHLDVAIDRMNEFRHETANRLVTLNQLIASVEEGQ